MPKAKLTEEEKQAQYDAWLAGPEAAAINKVSEKRPMQPPLELASKDINTPIQEFLNAVFALV